MPADKSKSKSKSNGEGSWTELSFEVRHLSSPEFELRKVKAQAVVLARMGDKALRTYLNRPR